MPFWRLRLDTLAPRAKQDKDMFQSCGTATAVRCTVRSVYVLCGQ